MDFLQILKYWIFVCLPICPWKTFLGVHGLRKQLWKSVNPSKKVENTSKRNITQVNKHNFYWLDFIFEFLFKTWHLGNSLVGWWLGLCAQTAGGSGWNLVGEVGSCSPPPPKRWLFNILSSKNLSRAEECKVKNKSTPPSSFTQWNHCSHLLVYLPGIYYVYTWPHLYLHQLVVWGSWEPQLRWSLFLVGLHTPSGLSTDMS